MKKPQIRKHGLSGCDGYEKIWYNSLKKYHNLKGPAVITYDENNNLFSEIYFIDGIIHRIDGPAFITYHNNKVINEVFYYYDKGFNSLKEMNNYINLLILR